MPSTKWLMVLALALAFISTEAFSIEIEHQGYRIVLSGEISSNDFEKFYEVTNNKMIVPIYLDSGGGLVTEAIKIGNLIRERGYETRLAANSTCASACVILLAGGVMRSADPTSRIGIHMSSGIFNDETIQKVTALIEDEGLSQMPFIVSFFEGEAGKVTLMQVNYFLKMGVSLRLLEHATSVHHLDIAWLTPSQAKDFNIVN